MRPSVLGDDDGNSTKAGESLLASSSLIYEGVSSEFVGPVTIGMDTGDFWNGLKLGCEVGLMLGNCVFDVTGTGNCEGPVESSNLVGIMLGVTVASETGIATGDTGARVIPVGT